MAARQRRQRAAPKNYLAPLAEVRCWFDEALQRSDPHPSALTLERLARDLQRIVNRRHNSDLEGAPLESLKDVDGAEELYRRVRRIQQIAENLYSATRELEDYAGGYIWQSGNRTISLDELQEVLSLVSLVSVPPDPWPSGRPLTRGRPIELWHSVGREFARMVKNVMEEIAYKGRLKATDEESVTAIVGARAISWAYDIEVQPKGFAAAMRNRDRSKGRCRGIPSLSELFPDAKRIGVAKFK